MESSKDPQNDILQQLKAKLTAIQTGISVIIEANNTRIGSFGGAYYEPLNDKLTEDLKSVRDCLEVLNTLKHAKPSMDDLNNLSIIDFDVKGLNTLKPEMYKKYEISEEFKKEAEELLKISQQLSQSILNIEEQDKLEKTNFISMIINIVCPNKTNQKDDFWAKKGDYVFFTSTPKGIDVYRAILVKYNGNNYDTICKELRKTADERSKKGNVKDVDTKTLHDAIKSNDLESLKTLEKKVLDYYSHKSEPANIEMTSFKSGKNK